MAMRITRSSVEALKDALEVLADVVEIRDDMTTWLDLQDEPRTEETADDIRDAREAFEMRLDELLDACQATIDLLAPAKRSKAS